MNDVTSQNCCTFNYTVEGATLSKILSPYVTYNTLEHPSIECNEWYLAGPLEDTEEFYDHFLTKEAERYREGSFRTEIAIFKQSTILSYDISRLRKPSVQF